MEPLCWLNAEVLDELNTPHAFIPAKYFHKKDVPVQQLENHKLQFFSEGATLWSILNSNNQSANSTVYFPWPGPKKYSIHWKAAILLVWEAGEGASYRLSDSNPPNHDLSPPWFIPTSPRPTWFISRLICFACLLIRGFRTGPFGLFGSEAPEFVSKAMI